MGRTRVVGTMSIVIAPLPELWFDPNAVDDSMVVECWISHGPRCADAAFDPAPGDVVALDDGDGEVLRGEVLARSGDRLTVRLDLGGSGAAIAV